MAERLADDRLLLDANQISFAAIWAAGTADRRLGFARRGMELAASLGQEQSFVVSATLRAVVEGELGLVSDMWSSIAVARHEAERLHIPYGLIVLESVALPWLAMAGRFDECEEVLQRIVRLDAQMSLEQSGDATAGALLSLRLWQGRGAELAPMLMQMGEWPMPMAPIVIRLLLRAGLTDEAHRCYAEKPIRLPDDDWFAMLNWGSAAEVARVMADPALAAAAYEKLAPFAGRACCAGSGVASGPVDAYLALAASAVGEQELAGEHADAAEELMASWEVPLAAAWLGAHRARYGF